MGLTLLLGPARSGKSRTAVRMAGAWDGPVAVVATAEARDREMAARIARHRAARPASWETVEEPIDLGSALRKMPEEAAVIVDCLTLWVSNLMERGVDDAGVERRAVVAAREAARRPAPTIAVTNEVGWGIVPVEASVRRYRDLLGAVNQEWAALADRAFLVVAGRLLNLGVVEEVSDNGGH
jgi:adenosylcobinamide kinase / adenosylcobinamide-phosphate guanylyltransferase